MNNMMKSNRIFNEGNTPHFFGYFTLFLLLYQYDIPPYRTDGSFGVPWPKDPVDRSLTISVGSHYKKTAEEKIDFFR
jgi:hypothetical protein